MTTQPVPTQGEDTLLPCPFCGSGDIRFDHRSRGARVYCCDCRIVQPSPEIWNTRASPPPQEPMIPEGMALVLREPTEAMLLAAGKGPWVNRDKAAEVWSAMLTASPVPTAPESEVEQGSWSGDPHALAAELRRVAAAWAPDFRLPQLLRDAADEIETLTALHPPAPSREEIIQAMRANVKCDATGLAPAVASVYLVGFEEAADAILAALSPKGTDRHDVADDQTGETGAVA